MLHLELSDLVENESVGNKKEEEGIPLWKTLSNDVGRGEIDQVMFFFQINLINFCLKK